MRSEARVIEGFENLKMRSKAHFSGSKAQLKMEQSSHDN